MEVLVAQGRGLLLERKRLVSLPLKARHLQVLLGASDVALADWPSGARAGAWQIRLALAWLREAGRREG